MTDTIVLGLDGANWDLLDPWLEAGRLPNIAALREEGTFADMQSELPPVTCPNWRCYSTGKNPGKLGVFWWERIDTETRTLTTPTSRSFKSADIWDYLNDDGQTVGIMNLPMTYPPFEVDGFMIAGGPGSEQTDYTNPESFEKRLEANDYQLHPEIPVTSKDDNEAAEALVDLIDQRLETFRDLVREEDPDVAHLTVFYINVLQHFFYRDTPTSQAWEVIDKHIGAIREEHPDATLFLMSDHGCQDVDTVLYANSWLEEAGYLTTETGAGNAMSSLGINKKRVSKLAHKLGVHSLVTRLAPDTVADQIPETEKGFKREQKLEKVDWNCSAAVASGQGLIYVIDDDPAMVEDLVDDLATLENENGERIAREVMRRQDAYDGPYVEDAPAIVFDQRPGVHTSGAIGPNPVFADVGHWEAENVRTGLFLADGPAVEAGRLDGPISITDIAPTVLQSVDCPIPTDMDGESLPVFGDGAAEIRDPLPFEAGADRTQEEVQDRLEDLGYLE